MNLNLPQNEFLLTIGMFAIVLLMCITEIFFLWKWLHKPKNKNQLADHAPLRMMRFIPSLMEGLIAPFIIIELLKMAESSGLVGAFYATLPLSICMAVGGITCIFVGKILHILGTKKTLYLAFSLFLTCGIILLVGTNYYLWVLALAFQGAALELLFDSIGMLAGLTVDEDEQRQAFAGITAGEATGTCVGAGICSLLLLFISEEAVLCTYCLIAILGIGLTTFTKNYYVPIKSSHDVDGISLKEFLTQKEVLGFLILIFGLLLVIREYKVVSMPIYFASQGISEVTISRIFMLFGLCACYLGPTLTDYLGKKLSGLQAVLAPNIVVILGMLPFIVYPNVYTIVLACFLSQLSYTFGFPCQNTFYTNLDASQRFGVSKAQNIIFFAESFFYSVGPLFLGTLIQNFGVEISASVLAGMMTVFILIYLNIKR